MFKLDKIEHFGLSKSLRFFEKRALQSPWVSKVHGGIQFFFFQNFYIQKFRVPYTFKHMIIDTKSRFRQGSLKNYMDKMRWVGAQ